MVEQRQRLSTRNGAMPARLLLTLLWHDHAAHPHSNNKPRCFTLLLPTRSTQ